MAHGPHTLSSVPSCASALVGCPVGPESAGPQGATGKRAEPVRQLLREPALQSCSPSGRCPEGLALFTGAPTSLHPAHLL